MFDKLGSVLPPTTGGVIGAVTKVVTVDIQQYFDVATSAAIGAVVGYLVKLVLDWIKKKLNGRFK